MSVSGPAAAPPAEASAAEGVRRIFANGLSLLLAYILPRLFTVGAVVLAARVLGTTQFGAYGTAAAFAVILSIVATLGMAPLLVREMSRAPERAGSWLRAAHRVKAASNAIMLALLLVVGRWVLAYPAPVLGAALLLGVAYAVGAWVENFAAYYQSVERMHVWTQASALYGLVTGVLGAVLVVGTGSIVAFSAAPIAGQLASLSWVMTRLPAHVLRDAAVQRRDVRDLLRGLAPFAAAFVAITVYSKVDVLLLARLRSADDVGLYAAAYKFIDLAQAMALVVAAAVYPRLSRAAPRGAAAGRWAGTRVVELAALGSALAGAFLLIARAPVVALLFGDAYAASVPAVALLAAAVPLLALNIVGGYVLGATGHMHDVARLYSVAVAAKIALNVWLAPGSGATGAAAAMLSTEFLLACAMVSVLHRRVAASPGRRAFAALVATAVAATLAATAPDPTGGWLAGAALLVTALLIVHALGIVPARERAIVLEALGVRPAAVRS